MILDYDKDINGEQFINELIAAGVKIDPLDFPRIENNKLIINVSKLDETKASKIWENHKAENWSIKKIAARQAVLDKLGLTDDEVATLLA